MPGLNSSKCFDRSGLIWYEPTIASTQSPWSHHPARAGMATDHVAAPNNVSAHARVNRSQRFNVNRKRMSSPRKRHASRDRALYRIYRVFGMKKAAKTSIRPDGGNRVREHT